MDNVDIEKTKLVDEVVVKDGKVVKDSASSGSDDKQQEQPNPKKQQTCQHEDHKGVTPKHKPRRFKKEITIDHDLYEFEMQQHLKKGCETGYTHALQFLVKYLKSDKPIKDFFAGREFHPLWEHVIKALDRADEWTEFEVEKTKQETPQ